MDSKIELKDILKNIFTTKAYLITLIASLFFSVAILLVGSRFAIPSLEEQVMFNIIDESKRVSNHLMNVYKRDKSFEHMQTMKEDLGIYKLKFFDPDGLTIYSTSKSDIGKFNTYDYYHNIVVAKKEVFYKIVKKGKKSLEGKEVSIDVAEVYIPMLNEAGNFQYSFEVYYDITKKIENFNTLTDRINKLNIAISSIFFIFVLSQLYSASRSSIQRTNFQHEIFKSEKMASMGEMIGNIAHQWRQPLSAISSTASSVIVSQEIGVLEPKDIKQNMNNIIKSTEFLSDTIETFSNFLKEEKEVKTFVVQERIDTTLQIIGSTLANKNIKVENGIDYNNPIEVTLIEGELPQVLINILNNAKDVLVEKNIEDKWIKISLNKTATHAVISIEDNAGGIPKDALPKIFEAYFTTKHQSQGTGLGLHMSYKIVTESLGGKLYAKNTKNGAKFFIELPLN